MLSRLKIPAIRSVLEYMKWVSSELGNKYSAKIHSFLLLFVLFVIALEFYDPEKINLMEKVFMVYAAGFCLEKLAAMQEHGLRGKQFLHHMFWRADSVQVYIHGTWVRLAQKLRTNVDSRRTGSMLRSVSQNSASKLPLLIVRSCHLHPLFWTSSLRRNQRRWEHVTSSHVYSTS